VGFVECPALHIWNYKKHYPVVTYASKAWTWRVSDKRGTEATEIITDKHSDGYLGNSKMHEKLQTNGKTILHTE